MKMLLGNLELPFCSMYIKSKIIRQLYYNVYILSEILGFHIYLDIRKNANVYIILKGYSYFILLVDDTTKVT